MSLSKQLVHLNMTGGLQRKDDERLVIPSKLAVADNVQFDDASTVVRRGGQTTLDAVGGLGGRLRRSFTHQGNAYLEAVDYVSDISYTGGIWSVLGTSGAFNRLAGHNKTNTQTPPREFTRGAASTSRVGTFSRGALEEVVPVHDGSLDSAILGDYTCIAWETLSTDGLRIVVRVKVINDVTGVTVFENSTTSLDSNSATHPRVVASVAQSKFFIYYASINNGASTWAVNMLAYTPPATSFSSLQTVVTPIASATATDLSDANIALFDVAYSADAASLAIVVKDSSSIILYTLSTTNGYTSTWNANLPSGSAPRSLTLLVTEPSAGDYVAHVFYGVNTNSCKGIFKHLSSGFPTAEASIGTGPASSVVGKIVAYEDPDADRIRVAFDSITTTSGVVSSTLVAVSLIDDEEGYTSTIQVYALTPWVIEGRFAPVNSRLYLPVRFISEQYQGTVYVVDLKETYNAVNLGQSGVGNVICVARLDYGECLNSTEHWHLSNRVQNTPIRNNTLSFLYYKYESNLRLAGALVDQQNTVLTRAVLDFEAQLQHEEIGGVTFLAGACPHIFDGLDYVEENFHHGPEINVNTALSATASAYELPDVSATVTVCFTVAWTDAQGNWHESAPSNEVSYTVVSGSGNLYIPTSAVIIPPTLKPNSIVVMYRTLGSSTDTQLYLALRNGVTVVSDATLASGEQLYTAGGVLPNTPAPACRHVSTFQKRLVVSGCGDGTGVYWSKQHQRGFGIEFSTGDITHKMTVPSDKGRVVGTEELDDRLIILCENGAGTIFGTGPAATGTQGQYSEFSTIMTELGASWDSPKSILRGPEGIWFRSQFGMRLISRGGALAIGQDGKQVGSEVDGLVSGNIVAVSGGAKQQLRFYQSSGTVLVWDSQWRQWTRFTGMANIDALYAGGRYYHLSNYTSVLTEQTPLLRYTNEAAYLDVSDANVAATEFSGYIETPWLSFSGIQGFQRVYRVMFLGKNVDSSVQAQSFSGTVGYDFNQTSPPTDETFAASVTPSTLGLVQFQHHLARQKCETIKLGLSFKPVSTNTGRFRLTDLTLQVGVKHGYFKLPSSQRF